MSSGPSSIDSSSSAQGRDDPFGDEFADLVARVRVLSGPIVLDERNALTLSHPKFGNGRVLVLKPGNTPIAEVQFHGQSAAKPMELSPDYFTLAGPVPVGLLEKLPKVPPESKVLSLKSQEPTYEKHLDVGDKVFVGECPQYGVGTVVGYENSRVVEGGINVIVAFEQVGQAYIKHPFPWERGTEATIFVLSRGDDLPDLSHARGINFVAEKFRGGKETDDDYKTLEGILSGYSYVAVTHDGQSISPADPNLYYRRQVVTVDECVRSLHRLAMHLVYLCQKFTPAEISELNEEEKHAGLMQEFNVGAVNYILRGLFNDALEQLPINTQEVGSVCSGIGFRLGRYAISVGLNLDPGKPEDPYVSGSQKYLEASIDESPSVVLGRVHEELKDAVGEFERRLLNFLSVYTTHPSKNDKEETLPEFEDEGSGGQGEGLESEGTIDKINKDNEKKPSRRSRHTENGRLFRDMSALLGALAGELGVESTFSRSSNPEAVLGFGKASGLLQENRRRMSRALASVLTPLLLALRDENQFGEASSKVAEIRDNLMRLCGLKALPESQGAETTELKDIKSLVEVVQENLSQDPVWKDSKGNLKRGTKDLYQGAIKAIAGLKRALGKVAVVADTATPTIGESPNGLQAAPTAAPEVLNGEVNVLPEESPDDGAQLENSRVTKPDLATKQFDFFSELYTTVLPIIQAYKSEGDSTTGGSLAKAISELFEVEDRDSVETPLALSSEERAAFVRKAANKLRDRSVWRGEGGRLPQGTRETFEAVCSYVFQIEATLEPARDSLSGRIEASSPATTSTRVVERYRPYLVVLNQFSGYASQILNKLDGDNSNPTWREYFSDIRTRLSAATQGLEEALEGKLDSSKAEIAPAERPDEALQVDLHDYLVLTALHASMRPAFGQFIQGNPVGDDLSDEEKRHQEVVRAQALRANKVIQEILSLPSISLFTKEAALLPDNLMSSVTTHRIQAFGVPSRAEINDWFEKESRSYSSHRRMLQYLASRPHGDGASVPTSEEIIEDLTLPVDLIPFVEGIGYSNVLYSLERVGLVRQRNGEFQFTASFSSFVNTIFSIDVKIDIPVAKEAALDRKPRRGDVGYVPRKYTRRAPRTPSAQEESGGGEPQPPEEVKEVIYENPFKSDVKYLFPLKDGVSDGKALRDLVTVKEPTPEEGRMLYLLANLIITIDQVREPTPDLEVIGLPEDPSLFIEPNENLLSILTKCGMLYEGNEHLFHLTQTGVNFFKRLRRELKEPTDALALSI